MLASFAALRLFGRARARTSSHVWTVAAALAFSGGVWTMHFLGMLAIELPIAIRYSGALTLLSIVPVLAASAAVFAILRPRSESSSVRRWCIAAGLGAGIGGMHYVGMASIAVAPGLTYRPALISVSIAAAVLFAYVAVRLIDGARSIDSMRRQTAFAATMACAVTAMHYIAMAGTQFAPNAVCIAPGTGLGNDALAYFIIGNTILGLLVATALATVDAHRTNERAQLAEALEAANLKLRERTERAEALAAEARTAQALFLRSFQQAAIGMALVSPEGKWLRVNRAVCAMLGYAHEELVTMTFQQVTHPDDLGLDLMHVHALLNGEASAYQMEKRYVDRDGRTIWASLSVSLITDETGAPLHFFSQIEDITARKQMELDLAKQTAFLHAVIEAVPAIVCAKDDRGRFLLANQACCDIIGRPREAVLGRTDLELSYAPQAHRAMVQDREVIATLSARQWHDEWQTPDGKRHWLHKNKRGVQLSDGTRYMVGASLDVTDTYALQLQMSHQHEFVTQLIDTLPSPVFVKNDQHQFLLVNKAYCEAAGASKAAIIGTNGSSLHADPSLEHHLAEDDQVLSDGIQIQREETNLFHRDGHHHWLKVKGRVRLASGGFGVAGMLFDITERQHMEEELRTHRDQLQKLVSIRTRDLESALATAKAANQAKSEFLMNMSHELRTPMHAILSFASLGDALRWEPSPATAKAGRYFSNIRSSGTRLLTLLDNLLDLSKLEAGCAQFSLSTRALAPLLATAIEEHRPLAAAKAIRINAEMTNEPLFVNMDQDPFVRVIANLLTNAIKFTPNGGLVTVTLTRTSDDRALIEVTDTGVGIPIAELENIFDKFIQSSRTRTNAGGTGLGLAICREIVREHAGHIWATSRLDGGACLSIALPLQPTEENPAHLSDILRSAT